MSEHCPKCEAWIPYDQKVRCPACGASVVETLRRRDTKYSLAFKLAVSVPMLALGIGCGILAWQCEDWGMGRVYGWSMGGWNTANFLAGIATGLIGSAAMIWRI